MSWISVLVGLLKLAQAVANIVERKQLMAAGEATAIRKALEETNARVEKANAARRAAAATGMRDDDPYRRD